MTFLMWILIRVLFMVLIALCAMYGMSVPAIHQFVSDLRIPLDVETFWRGYLFLFMALFFPDACSGLFGDQPFGRMIESVLSRKDDTTPKKQLTDFAQAYVQNNSHPSGPDFLDTVLMQEARSYIKTMVMETDERNKKEAVMIALSTTHLDEAVVTGIGNHVALTSALVDQISDFEYTGDGRACAYTVNLWMSQPKPNGKIDVAFMVSGSSFKKSLVTSTIEVDEPMYGDQVIYHPATWTQHAWTEHLRVPIVDPVTREPKTRRVQKPVFDTTAVKPQEIEFMRNHLITMSSRDALMNYAPEKALKMGPSVLMLQPSASTES